MIQNFLFGVGFETLPENLKLIDKHVYLLISDILVKFQSQRKLATIITHFTIQFYLKNTARFMNVNSLNIMKNIIPQHNQKPYSLYKFSSKPVSG